MRRIASTMLLCVSLLANHSSRWAVQAVKARASSSSSSPSSSFSPSGTPTPTLQLHKLPRVYLPRSGNEEGLAVGQVVALSQEDSLYVSSVMRLKAGFCLRVFNERSGEFLCKIRDVPKRTSTRDATTTVEVTEALRSPPVRENASGFPFALVFAPIKKSRMKVLLEKCTEIGVEHFFPVVTQNTNHPLEPADRESYERILVQSTEQSERLSVPTLHQPMSLAQLTLALAPDGTPTNAIMDNVRTAPFFEKLLVCRERASEEAGEASVLPLLTALKNLPLSQTQPQLGGAVDPKATLLGVFVGPEGGFTEQEFALLAQSSAAVSFVSLGCNVLRAETAAIFALSVAAAAVDCERKP